MGLQALAHGSGSLGWGEMVQWEWKWRRGSVGILRGKGLKASMGNITIDKGEVF